MQCFKMDSMPVPVFLQGMNKERTEEATYDGKHD